ncbi:uracil-xanthine permease family protein [Goodfellowiella coeruleoviolacea]|uniref:Uracil-xanthine permease n=1 Tax=Goodfellowiella coeruleoviolacea TaxID=334858 RepID=A0AAE3KIS4_9PSEU|nr:solute carrier family 23 protein [Goodfellowiella coeruleoviolacea]MCP2169566.1 uracil-xanthine permease [Goodfellowiella coeruleoviolacea]
MALWTVHGDGRRIGDEESVAPDERLSWPLTIGFGLQHLLAMFAATVLVPVLTGFPATTTLLFSGLGTLLFLLLTRNRVPSYLGSSFAFVGPLVAAQEDGVPAQLGGVLTAGLLLVAVGIAVKALGVRLLESLMPPVVTGGVVILIGLNLSHEATQTFQRQPLLGGITMLVSVLTMALGRGLVARLSVLFGVLVGWLVGAAVGAISATRASELAEAAWLGLPRLQAPELRPSVAVLVLPVVIVLVAETTGHVKAVGSVVGRNLDGSVGDALIANGLATSLAGVGGGSGTTTYTENIGVLVVTRVHSTAACAVAALGAVLLSFSPKFGALINTVPIGVTGGATLVLYGLAALIGVRIWTENRVDVRDPVNLAAVAVALVAGVGDLTLTVGGVRFSGIAWGCVLMVTLYPLLHWLRGLRRAQEPTG